MPSNQTANYQLNQWAKPDRIMMDDFNADNQKLDAALKANADAIAEHGVKLTQLGNCEIEIFSYTGTGKYGAENPTTITFPQMPAFFIVYGTNFFMVAEGQRTDSLSVNQSRESGSIGISNYTLTWTGNTVKFYSSSGTNFQGNLSGAVYRVIAFYTKN